MKSAFSAVESKRKCVTLATEFYHVWFSRIMKIAIEYYVKFDVLCLYIELFHDCNNNNDDVHDNDNKRDD